MGRHALGTMLLGGWLLMTPPVSATPGGQKFVDSDAPVAAWRQSEAFDTAERCSESIGRLIKKIYDHPEIKMSPDITAILQARCIPSEYIYPPKKCP